MPLIVTPSPEVLTQPDCSYFAPGLLLPTMTFLGHALFSCRYSFHCYICCNSINHVLYPSLNRISVLQPSARNSMKATVPCLSTKGIPTQGRPTHSIVTSAQSPSSNPYFLTLQIALPGSSHEKFGLRMWANAARTTPLSCGGFTLFEEAKLNVGERGLAYSRRRTVLQISVS